MNLGAERFQGRDVRVCLVLLTPILLMQFQMMTGFRIFLQRWHGAIQQFMMSFQLRFSVVIFYESYDLTMDDQAGSQVWEDPCSDMLQIEIGLDSGADISVMPFSFESYGSETFSGGVTRLRDAQGNLMKHGKTKRVTLDCGDSTLVENFTMCSVATPLLALGKMIRQGWNFQKEDHSLFLVKDGAQIPVKVRGNALSISAHVKRAQADFWTMEGTTLKRVHNVARCSKFSPIDSGCPFSTHFQEFF